MQLSRYTTGSEPRRLSGQIEQRGFQTGLSSGGGFLFGGIFIAAGILVTLIGAKVIPVKASSVKAPYWVLLVFGGVFVMAGLSIVSMAWRQRAARLREGEAARLYPHEPAFQDYPWNPQGFAPPRWGPAIRMVMVAVVFGLFLSMFNCWAFIAGGPLLVKWVVGLFDLIWLLVAWQAVVRAGHAMKFGGSRIEFAEFPFRRGKPARISWHPGNGIVQVKQGTFTLRCVREFWEQSGAGKNRSRHLVHEQIWNGSWHLDEPHTLTRGEQIGLRFDPPVDAPGTNLRDATPVFWELEVKLDVPGIDFAERYLVPVY